MRRLIVAPHADDEVLGCGGLIAKYPDTAVAIVAHIEIERLTEFFAARRAMGQSAIASDLLGNFPDGSVGLSMFGLVSWMDTVFAKVKPDEVYLPYPGSHQDHVATYEAGMRAARQSMHPEHWMPPTVLVYETPMYDLDLHAWPLRFSVFESLSEEQVFAKAKAMEAYESQNGKPHPGSPDEVVARARSLGLARDLEYAEQFAPVRLVRP